MTICIATSNFPPQVGGIATFSWQLANALIKVNQRVIVLTFADSHTEAAEDSVLTEQDIIIVHLRKKYERYRQHYQRFFSSGSLDAPGWISAGLAMRDWLMENHQAYKIDIIEAGDYGGLASFLIHPSLPPVVVTGHGSFFQIKKINTVISDAHTKVVVQLEELACRNADGLIAHNQKNQAYFAKHYNKRSYFVPAPWEISREENNIPETKALVVIGGLQQIKGATVTAEAISQLSKTDNTIIVEWIGGDSYTAPGAQKMSIFLQKKFNDTWGKQFKWLSELDHAHAIQKMEQASIVVIPSLWEAFSYAALEAASAGKALIITDTTGIAALFTHGEDAWIIPADSPDALARAILHLYQAPLLRQKIGSNAKKLVERFYQGDSYIQQRIEKYNQVISKRITRPLVEKEVEDLLKSYCTMRRKLYFRFKKGLKKIAGKK